MDIVDKHKTWKEVEMTLKEFLSFCENTRDEDGYDPYFINDVIIVFEDGSEMIADEIIENKNGKISLSSYENGLLDWHDSKQTYVKRYHMFATEMGDIKKVVVHHDDYVELSKPTPPMGESED